MESLKLKAVFSRSVLKHFTVRGSESDFAFSIAVARVLFGLIVVYLNADVLGVAVVMDDPMMGAARCIAGILAGFMVSIGFLTPLALGWIFCFEFWPGVFLYNLGIMVMILTGWVLLLLGAGLQHGLDARIAKTRYGSWLRWGSMPPTQENFAKVRLFGLFLYWGICFSAMAFHFHDPLWLRGEVLPLAFTSSYLTDHRIFVEMLRDASPFLFQLTGKAILFVQGVWELFLIFLFFVPGLRVFAHVQGYLFFGVSLLGLNLGVLPYAEIVFWLLLFNDPARLRGLLRNSSRALTENSGPQRRESESRLAHAIMMIGLIVSAHFIVETAYFNIVHGNPDASGRFGGVVLKATRSVYSQAPVNVFNLNDLQMNAYNPVLFELDETGRPRRITGFYGIHGGRLSLLKNDYLYFIHSLQWQRSLKETKFLNGDPGQPSPQTMAFLRRFASLDFCLQRSERPKTYGVAIFERLLERNESLSYWYWTKSKLVGTTRITITPESIGQQDLCRLSYDLGPGHFHETERITLSLDFLKAHWMKMDPLVQEGSRATESAKAVGGG